MELISILRVLWLRRLWVSVGLVLSACVAVLIGFKVELGLPPDLGSRQYTVGIASATILIDSPSSQVADLGDAGEIGPKADVSSLSARAGLLANLMALSPLKERIARRAGVDPRTLIATAPSVGMPPEESALDTIPDGPERNSLTISRDETLPIITADSQAASPELAARISSAAVEELQGYLKTIAAIDDVPDATQLVVSPLGPARFATVTRGPRRMFAIVGLLVVFGLWCTGIVLSVRLARSWREAAAAEGNFAAFDVSTAEAVDAAAESGASLASVPDPGPGSAGARLTGVERAGVRAAAP